MKLSKGDIVICVDNGYAHELGRGRHYRVLESRMSSAGGHTIPTVLLEGDNNTWGYAAIRFKLAKDVTRLEIALWGFDE